MIQKIKFLFIMALITNGISAQSQQKEQDSIFNNLNTAIVVIEFQKTWTQKGNFLNRLIRKPLRENNIVPRTIKFLDSARQKGYTVIHAPLVLDKSNKEEYKKMPFAPKLMGAFTANTWKAEFTEGIKKENDIVANGRTGFDATEGSDLFSLVKGYDNLLVGGFITDQCVEATIKSLKSKGYNCVMITDATATSSKRKQKKIEERIFSLDSKQLLTKMK
ncbi:cysteine hydrolase [Aquimarina sp. U1-2]|uniref:cysteine hydrolase n=1 Tax=Aquimarina sp. U1-2 TaxID=2823141 RepID=UPI001AED06B1|nr:cysteine hydrolase [Aquimarina sp. U1-2]MBP2831535.1 cysteine hydrolase [Aquimarina sp. U1-2]